MTKDDRATSLGIIVQENRFLMVQQNKHGRTFWNFPGGHVEEGETPEQACIRELYEETGYRIRIKDYVSTIRNKHLFLAEIVSGQLQLEEGLRDIAWVSEAEEDKWDSKTKQIVEMYRSCLETRDSNSSISEKP